MQHLQVLETCGLVRSEKTGRVRTCHLEPGVLRAAEAWITSQRTTWENRLDRLGDYLADPDQANPDQANSDQANSDQGSS
jgi:hypothetical protein